MEEQCPRAVLPNFYFDPEILKYTFGATHPLRPERLERTLALLDAMGQGGYSRPEDLAPSDLERIHSPEYIQAVRDFSDRPDADSVQASRYGLGPGDNPAFEGMFEASVAYCACSAQAAKDVCRGAPLASSLGGGLHHAQRSFASGFCVFNDPAIALHILRDRFDRVAYVDIDVHHGDGVQFLFWDDPTVLTCSIHEDGRYLYPGTGAVEESGPAGAAVNVPLPPGTTGDTWLWAFEEGILPALEVFAPQAAVLQMGTDAHFLDPLAHLNVAAQDWLAAIRRIKETKLPLVALGGGGYSLDTVPRMWVSACLTLADVPFADSIPAPFADQWQMPSFFDPSPPGPSGSGRAEAENAIDSLRSDVFPNLPRPQWRHDGYP